MDKTTVLTVTTALFILLPRARAVTWAHPGKMVFNRTLATEELYHVGVRKFAGRNERKSVV